MHKNYYSQRLNRLNTRYKYASCRVIKENDPLNYIDKTEGTY